MIIRSTGSVICLFTLLLTHAVLAEDGWRPWAFSLRVAEAYDDNRDGTETGKESLLETRVEPRIDIRAVWDQTEADLYYSPSLRARDNPRANQNSADIYHHLGFNIQRRISRRLRVGIKDAFSFTDDPAVMVGGRTFRENTDYTLNRVHLTGSYEMLPERLVVSADGSYMGKRYDLSEFAKVADEDRISIDIATKYVTRSRINISGGLSFRDTGLSTQYRADRDSRLIYAGGGLEKNFGVWGVRGQIGLEQVSFDNAAISDMQRPAADIQFVYVPSDISRVHLLIRHRIMRGDISPYASQERTSVSLKALRKVSQKLTMTFEGMYGRGKYDADTLALGINGIPVVKSQDGTDRLVATILAATYKINRNFALECSYGHEDWNASSHIRPTHDRNTVMMAVRTRF